MDMFEFEELLAAIMGISDDEWDDIPEQFYDKYEIDFDSAYELVKAMLPFCTVGKSPLTGKVYQGFAKDGVFLVKREVEE